MFSVYINFPWTFPVLDWALWCRLLGPGPLPALSERMKGGSSSDCISPIPANLLPDLGIQRKIMQFGFMAYSVFLPGWHLLWICRLIKVLYALKSFGDASGGLGITIHWTLQCWWAHKFKTEPNDLLAWARDRDGIPVERVMVIHELELFNRHSLFPTFNQTTSHRLKISTYSYDLAFYI